MKRWMIVPFTIGLALTTAGVVTAFALGGDGAAAAEEPARSSLMDSPGMDFGETVGGGPGPVATDGELTPGTLILVPGVTVCEEVGGTGHATPDLGQEDAEAIIGLTLERALVDREIPDYDFALEGRDWIILSTENLDGADALVPGEMGGVRLVLLSPREIQEKADTEGDFMYLSFLAPVVEDDKIEISLANSWAVARDSGTGYLSGGFFTLEYTKVEGEWSGTLLAIAMS